MFQMPLGRIAGFKKAEKFKVLEISDADAVR
jgi:hypothetical protein